MSVQRTNRRGEPAGKCSECAYVHLFNARPDEVAAGLTMGCKYPDWEGYTIDDSPACGGVFFVKARSALNEGEKHE